MDAAADIIKFAAQLVKAVVEIIRQVAAEIVHPRPDVTGNAIGDIMAELAVMVSRHIRQSAAHGGRHSGNSTSDQNTDAACYQAYLRKILHERLLLP